VIHDPREVFYLTAEVIHDPRGVFYYLAEVIHDPCEVFYHLAGVIHDLRGVFDPAAGVFRWDRDVMRTMSEDRSAARRRQRLANRWDRAAQQGASLALPACGCFQGQLP
jgi:hypothetical protein